MLRYLFIALHIILELNIKNMSVEKGVRWVQRFENYRRALKRLAEAVEIIRSDQYSNNNISYLINEGLIQCFEFTHELAWKVMKDYEEYQGMTEIFGSRDAIRHALRFGIIDNEQWMQTISDRNVTSHQYDDDTAKRIVDNIINVYYPLFVEYEKVMLEKIGV